MPRADGPAREKAGLEMASHVTEKSKGMYLKVSSRLATSTAHRLTKAASPHLRNGAQPAGLKSWCSSSSPVCRPIRPVWQGLQTRSQCCCCLQWQIALQVHGNPSKTGLYTASFFFINTTKKMTMKKVIFALLLPFNHIHPYINNKTVIICKVFFFFHHSCWLSAWLKLMSSCLCDSKWWAGQMSHLAFTQVNKLKVFSLVEGALHPFSHMKFSYSSQYDSACVV